LDSILTNEGRYTCEIKCSIAVAKASFNKKMAFFTYTLYLELRKKLIKCYVWSIDLYGAEIWTLRTVDQKHMESFKMWCWMRMEKKTEKLQPIKELMKQYPSKSKCRRPLTKENEVT
jgi:hypothetical protein